MRDKRAFYSDQQDLEPPLRASRWRAGFTLLEALLASTILAIVASSALLPLAAGVQQVNAAADLEQATALGEAMMEEVLARPFFEPGQTSPTLGPDWQLRLQVTAFREIRGQRRDNQDDFQALANDDQKRRDERGQPGLGRSGDSFNRAKCSPQRLEAGGIVAPCAEFSAQVRKLAFNRRDQSRLARAHHSLDGFELHVGIEQKVGGALRPTHRKLLGQVDGSRNLG